MECNLANLFEIAVDAYPDREYLVANGKRRTYAEMEARANQLAHHLAAQGIGPGDHVGIYAYNSVEWVETLWAVFKLRAVWINVNYRYVKDELHYLLTNADLKALVHQREFSPLVGSLLPDLPDLRHVIVIEDGTDVPYPSPDAISYEDALAGQSTARDFGPRSADDIYILYTGGTTGMPKGVVWRHEDVFYALGGGTDAMTNTRIEDPGRMVEQGANGAATHLPVAPLMHGATQWAVMGRSFVGSKIVLMAKFDPHEVWDLVEKEGVNSIMITGDAMGKPLIESLDDAGSTHDLSSLFAVVSSAALFSAPVKDQFFARLPTIMITDAIGSSETGNNGMSVVTPGHTAMKSGPTVQVIGHSVVLDENLNPVEPGSGVIGKIARYGRHPLGLLQRPEKDGGGLHHHTGDPLCHARGLRHRRGRRQDHPPRPGLHRHQLRRREDLPRGGRVGRALPPRRDGRHCLRRTGRTMGSDRGRHHSAPGGPCASDAREHPRALSRQHRRLQAAPSPPCRRCRRAIPQRQTRLHLGHLHRHGRRG